jgi:hypothetical protein
MDYKYSGKGYAPEYISKEDTSVRIHGCERLEGLKAILVDELPETGEDNILYLVRSPIDATKYNITEYIWLNNEYTLLETIIINDEEENIICF